MNSPDVPDPGLNQRGPMFWLPPNGFGNGITALAWAELADLAEEEINPVLAALTEAGIAAYFAVPHRPPHSHSTAQRPPHRLWVNSLRYRRAEDILMELLATLHGRRPPSGGRNAPSG